MNRSTFFKTLFGLALAPFIPVPKKPTTYKFMSPDVLLGGTSGIQENCHRAYSIFEHVDRFFQHADPPTLAFYGIRKRHDERVSAILNQLEIIKKSYLSTMK